jgi:hypothetical protein
MATRSKSTVAARHRGWEFGFVWVCFFERAAAVFVRKPLGQQGLRWFRLAGIGFVLHKKSDL